MTKRLSREEFDSLKVISLPQAAQYLNLQLKPNGKTEEGYDNFRCQCPVHGGDKKGLSVTPEKPAFQCWLTKKGGNDATSLVAHVLKIDNHEAGALLQQHFRIGKDKRRHRATPPAPTIEATSADTAEPDGIHPAFELLSFTEEDIEALTVKLEDGRIIIVIRYPDGREWGTIGLGTTPDLVPLIEVQKTRAEPATEPKQTAEELRKLWRVVG